MANNIVLNPGDGGDTVRAIDRAGVKSNVIGLDLNPAGAEVLMAGSMPVTASAGTNLNTSALALEAGGHLASLDTKTPALGQALAAAAVPVVLTAAQIATLTPPTSLATVTTVTTVAAVTAITNALPAGGNTIGGVTLTAATTGGSSAYSLASAATTNATNVKASAGQVYGYSISNTTSAALYVKLYDAGAAPTAGSGTPVRRIMVPANGVVERSIPGGIVFASGIGFTIVTNPADADATAVALNAILLNIDYK